MTHAYPVQRITSTSPLPMNKKGIIALGNPLRSDDGIGITILQRLEERGSEDIALLDGGTGGLKILHLLAGLNVAIIVDAVRFGGQPGAYVFFKPQEATSHQTPVHAHNPALFDAIKLSQQLNECPHKIMIMGIQPETTALGTDLSESVAENLDEMVDALLQKIREL